MRKVEAKEILTNLSHGGPIPHPQDNIDALNLGAKALEFLTRWEIEHDGEKLVTLLGETED